MSKPYILQIETATQVCSVALSAGGETLLSYDIDEPNVHASRLTLTIEQVLRECSVTIDRLAAVAVSKGPGSYTGLRIGVSTAKGLCYAADLPLIAIDTLQAMVHGYAAIYGPLHAHEGLFCPMIDARRMEVYTAVYNGQLGLVAPVSATIVDVDTFSNYADQGQIVLFGSGADKLQAAFADNSLVHVFSGFRNSAAHMSELASLAFQKQQFEDVAYMEPYYLKDFVATVPKNQRINA